MLQDDVVSWIRMVPPGFIVEGSFLSKYQGSLFYL